MSAGSNPARSSCRGSLFESTASEIPSAPEGRLRICRLMDDRWATDPKVSVQVAPDAPVEIDRVTTQRTVHTDCSSSGQDKRLQNV